MSYNQIHCFQNYFRELEELEAIKEAEEAALAEAEAAAAEAAEAMGEILGMNLGGGNGSGDGKGMRKGPDMASDSDLDSPTSNTVTSTQAGNVIDMVAAASAAGAANTNMAESSRESLTSNMAKYAVREGSARSEMFRSYEAGVDLPHHNHHHHHYPTHAQSNSDMDNATDRMSLRSLSYVYHSDESLPNTGASANMTSSNQAGAGASVPPSNGKLGSLPASPYGPRRASKSSSFGSHVRLHEKYSSSKKPLVLFTYLDAQEHLPYADDSAAVTPKSEANGYIVVDTPTRMSLARKYSYTSHSGKVDSYNSHTDLR